MSKQKDSNWFKRHKILTVIGAFILIAIIASAAGNKNPTANQSASSSSGKATNNRSATVAGLNQPADDGKLQFTVTNLQCNQTQVESPDDSSITTSAGSPYCIVSLTIKNISTSAQTFEADSQYLYDSTNKQYSLDSTASILASSESSQFIEDPTVNPGVTLTGQLIFDIPATVTPSYAMLHDSIASDGVKVNLQ